MEHQGEGGALLFNISQKFCFDKVYAYKIFLDIQYYLISSYSNL